MWAPGCTNRLDQNSNIIALVTIIMLLWLCCSIFRTHAHLMLEIYSKPCQLFKIYLRHLKTLARSEQFIQAFAGMFRNIQQYSTILRKIKAYWDIFTYWGITEACWALFRHIQNSALPLLIQPCHIQNLGTFTTRGIFKHLWSM